MYLLITIKTITKWETQHLDNQFNNATKSSFKKADILFADHYAKLDAEKSDAVILILYNRFKTVKDIWDTRYSDWISADAVYRGETDRFEAMLSDLSSSKISQWDAKVQNVFLEKTPDYVIIFPNGRSPFQEGTRDQRIAEVDALAQRLATYPALAVLQLEVQTFGSDMNLARNTQQSKEELLDKASDLLEEQRIKVGIVMYANPGRLMDKFSLNPNSIARFFDLGILRNVSDFPVQGTVLGSAVFNIIERAFQSGTQLILKNTGNTPLMFCLSATKDGACNGGVIIQPNSEEVHSINDLGDTANSFLNVTNLGAVQGRWEVDEV